MPPSPSSGSGSSSVACLRCTPLLVPLVLARRREEERGGRKEGNEGEWERREGGERKERERRERGRRERGGRGEEANEYLLYSTLVRKPTEQLAIRSCTSKFT